MSTGDQDYRSGMAGFDYAVRQHEAYHKPAGSGDREARAEVWAREAVESARPQALTPDERWPHDRANPTDEARIRMAAQFREVLERDGLLPQPGEIGN